MASAAVHVQFTELCKIHSCCTVFCSNPDAVLESGGTASAVAPSGDSGSKQERRRDSSDHDFSDDDDDRLSSGSSQASSSDFS